ncbi:aspartate kinase [Vallitalea guaymasensis]|uniref:Aspartokinase n=1 Tax=Vallitalea guaymasensis TaxID=1185412 RepID=A0A8J8SEL6_9FIRM|nr:aspartate kinase [Vallitalea guaymasensis]QUH31839.1 aspartate kinase [Vallitalea guaymasensis]
MNILIQKFGGTSMATEETRKNVADKIMEAKKIYDNVVVVVSAIGRLGAPYATDSLLHLVNYKNTKLSSKEIDLLMSVGEIISSLVLTNTLLESGIDACALTGGGAGIITDDNYNSADVININTEPLMKLLNEGKIPVVAGFQGVTIGNDVTTLGRGGSDTTASLLGEALNASAVEIYTDVDGIMTADPRICKSAKIIDEISYNEVFQMAGSGAKVIHPRAVEVARRAGIPLIIKNTFNNSKGTSIKRHIGVERKKTIEDKLITSIAHKTNITQVSIKGDIDDENFFTDLARENVSIDIINIFPERKVFTIDDVCKDKVIRLIEKYEAPYTFIDDCCKVTIIGEKITGVPGVMAKIIRCLSKSSVEILQTADSLSTIACLIKEKDLVIAAEALHKEFMLG